MRMLFVSSLVFFSTPDSTVVREDVILAFLWSEFSAVCQLKKKGATGDVFRDS